MRDQPDSETVAVRVKEKGRAVIEFNVGMNTPVEKIMRLYAAQTRRDVVNLRFYLHSTSIDPLDTPLSLKFGKDDFIDVEENLVPRKSSPLTKPKPFNVELLTDRSVAGKEEPAKRTFFMEADGEWLGPFHAMPTCFVALEPEGPRFGKVLTADEVWNPFVPMEELEKRAKGCEQKGGGGGEGTREVELLYTRIRELEVQLANTNTDNQLWSSSRRLTRFRRPGFSRPWTIHRPLETISETIEERLVGVEQPYRVAPSWRTSQPPVRVSLPLLNIHSKPFVTMERAIEYARDALMWYKKMDDGSKRDLFIKRKLPDTMGHQHCRFCQRSAGDTPNNVLQHVLSRRHIMGLYVRGEGASLADLDALMEL